MLSHLISQDMPWLKSSKAGLLHRKDFFPCPTLFPFLLNPHLLHQGRQRWACLIRSPIVVTVVKAENGVEGLAEGVDSRGFGRVQGRSIQSLSRSSQDLH